MPLVSSPALKKWIDQYLADHPLRSKSVVMTVFGDVITPHGGKVWLGSLIDLLAPFGINDRLVRTSVFRLVEEGWLQAQRAGRRSNYSLHGESAARFERAYQRVYAPAYRPWAGSWTLVFANAEAISSGQRAELRKELLWEGYGVLAPSVFGHPTADGDTLKEIIARIGVQQSVYVCNVADSISAAHRPLQDWVSQAWELEPVIANYMRFIQDFAVLPKHLGARVAIDPQQAFVIRTLLVHEFRRVQLHDHQLPLELLPRNWPGKTAYDLCGRIYSMTSQAAERHVLQQLRGQDPSAPVAASYFFQRFGGVARTALKQGTKPGRDA
ncbi:MAG: phenylacetic acid degradation operon negative regulatory protein PaaX [Rhodoferax sp.]